MLVALIARVVAQHDGQIELERLVTPEMAERMCREAAVESGNRSEMEGQAVSARPAQQMAIDRGKAPQDSPAKEVSMGVDHARESQRGKGVVLD